MGALVLPLLLALAPPAHAGRVAVDIGSVHQALEVKPGVEAALPFTVGRFQVRLVVLEKPDARGWAFSVRLERIQHDVVEVLANERIVTGTSVDAIAEVDTRLGPMKLLCRG